MLDAAGSIPTALPDALRLVTHVFIQHKAEFSAITHDRVADTQNAAVHRQIQGGFLGAQRRDLQRQDASRQFLAVGETPYLLAVAEFVQAILVAPDFCAVALGEAAAVPVVMAVGEIYVLRCPVRCEPFDNLRRHARVDQHRRHGGVGVVGVDVGLDAFVEGLPVKNAGKDFFHGFSKDDCRTKESAHVLQRAHGPESRSELDWDRCGLACEGIAPMIVPGKPLGAATRHVPTVSVMMAAYNAQAFLAEAIESVLDQTLRDFELLVVDDASTDATSAITGRYARLDRRIRTLRLARNGGTGWARNAGLAHARAPFVAICDDDDRQMPGRLAAQVAYLESHPQHVMVGCKIRPFGDVAAGLPLAWLPGGDTLARPHVLFQALYVDSANLFRRDLASVHCLRYPSGPAWEDWVFQAQALRIGDIHVLPEVLLEYRRHAAQQTSPARLRASGPRTRATMLRVLEIAEPVRTGVRPGLSAAAP